MLALVISLISLIPANGAAHGADVSISPGNGFKYRVGVDFNLSCKFTFLSSMHFAQMWKEGERKKCLINMTSSQPNVTVILHITSAKIADTGNYSCSTHPDYKTVDAISPLVYIQITGSQAELQPISTVSVQETPSDYEELSGHHRQGSQATPSTPTTVSNQKLCSTDLHKEPDLYVSSLQGQMWYWMLLGKAAILLLSLASLAVKYKRGQGIKTTLRAPQQQSHLS
ncbi:uncharacterized protein LOC103156351 isoform X1 [Poecilia formosa]|uniref:uncharacterized protein LOC103156351 isoform X1 n=1 Tax=Poecilia formosa TaxID=48698 RepID=UPI0007B8ABEE|nr:PREDICTED: uncharacterized protein LOC103156351 isoform X1 [Poecilia formosa]